MKLEIERVKQFTKSQFSYLLYGFGFWFPVAIVIFILVFLFDNLERAGRMLLLPLLPERYFHTGYGVVFGLLLIYASGIVLKRTRIRQYLSKIPLIGIFFRGGEAITLDRLLHLSPCLFLMSPTCASYGWVLSEERVSTGQVSLIYTMVNVYYPNVPTIITGQVFPVRKDTVIKLGNSSKEIIDLLLYSFRSPEELIMLPWPGETPEGFVSRISNFGLNLTCQLEVRSSTANT